MTGPKAYMRTRCAEIGLSPSSVSFSTCRCAPIIEILENCYETWVCECFLLGIRVSGPEQPAIGVRVVSSGLRVAKVARIDVERAAGRVLDGRVPVLFM